MPAFHPAQVKQFEIGQRSLPRVTEGTFDVAPTGKPGPPVQCFANPRGSG